MTKQTNAEMYRLAQAAVLMRWLDTGQRVQRDAGGKAIPTDEDFREAQTRAEIEQQLAAKAGGPM